MKNILSILLAAMLVFTCAASSAFADHDPDGTITVTGSATVSTDAESAVVALGVTTSAAEASEASAKNAVAIDTLIKALMEFGIGKEDISTSYYYLNPVYNYEQRNEDGSYTLVGYSVSNNLSVRVRDIEKVGNVIDLALSNGANSCDGISFTADHAIEAQDQALEEAVKEACRRAELAAKACGRELGDVITLDESSSNGGLAVNSMRFAAVAEAASGAADTQILSNGLSFTATVRMTFELK